MSITINVDTFTTYEDLLNASCLTQAEKDEIQQKISLAGKRIEARQKKGVTQKNSRKCCLD